MPVSLRERFAWTAISAVAVGSLIGCSSDAQHAAKSNTFVCFKVTDPGPERFLEFAQLVRDYPPAAGLTVVSGYKRDAAVSVKLPPEENAQKWVDALPAALRHHEIVKSVDVENYDCAEVNA